jgi:hypothetical protein
MANQATSSYWLAPVGGFTIPAGTTVMVPPFAIHRDRRVSGLRNGTCFCIFFAFLSQYFHSPDDFEPEHFAPERVKMRNKEPFAYLPFSAGPRNCIGKFTVQSCQLATFHSPFLPSKGQKFASTEQKITVAKIFRRYKVISHMHELENRGLPELVLKVGLIW